MRLALSLLFACSAALALAAPSAPVYERPAFIPAPQKLELAEAGSPGFALGEGIRMDAALSHNPQGRALIRALQAAGVPVLPAEAEGDVNLAFTPTPLRREDYVLKVTPQDITIWVHDEEAFHLVAQTLAQAIVKDEQGQACLPAMDVIDVPLMRHRGLMLDCARHPIAVEEIKKILRVMARYKLNRLHWHLTDDQGWRLEIRSYPKLTTVGNYRPSSAIGPENKVQDGVPVSAFYSQEQVRELVAYAHALGIIIIPEIEIPGHASAAIAAYPELGNSDAPGFKPEVATNWGVFPTVLAPNEATFRFIDTVLAEVCELFPQAPYIHCGGDECPRVQWKNSPAARAFMEKNGLATPADIQHYFTRYCAAVLAKRGRRMVGWDEIQDAPSLPQDAIVMAWRGYKYDAVFRKAVENGHDIIACPNSHCYLNFGHKVWDPRPEYTAYGTAQDRDWLQLYAFDPFPAWMDRAQHHPVIGVQANAWGEVIPNARKLEYLLFPRLLALAEVAWLRKEKRADAADFARRLEAHYPYLDSEQLNFRQEDGTPRRDPAPADDSEN